MNIDQIRALSFEYAKGYAGKKRKITAAGQPCRHCARQPYYYTHWYGCPECRAVYLVDSARKWVKDRPQDYANRLRDKAWARNQPVAMPKTSSWTGTTTPDDQPPW